MALTQRGNPNLLKSIQQSAKKVSESNGISVVNNSNQVVERRTANPVPLNEEEIMKQVGNYMSPTQQTYNTPTMRQPVRENVGYDFQKALLDRLTESVQTVGDTKEYFNAVSSLFTLYAMGKLNEGVLNHISREDLREIRGIIREFKGIIDTH